VLNLGHTAMVNTAVASVILAANNEKMLENSRREGEDSYLGYEKQKENAVPE